MTDHSFEYKGVPIQITPTGVFTATIGSQKIRKPSLDAIKKHIEKSLSKKFETFSALEEASYSKKATPGCCGLRRITITDAREDKRASYWAKYLLIDSEGNGHNVVFSDTPENIEAWKEYAAYRAETKKIEEQRKAHEANLHQRLIKITARSYFIAPDPKSSDEEDE